MNKYEQKMYQLSQAEPPPGFKKQTKLFANIIIEADAEIADLRAKCDKLAGAVGTLRATYVDMRGNVLCKLCDAEAAYSYDIVHAPDCPVQIAREVKG